MRRQRILSKMKRIEIVVESDRVEALVRLVEHHATGYTLIPGATGLGEHGYREQKMVVLVTVVTADHLEAIMADGTYDLPVGRGRDGRRARRQPGSRRGWRRAPRPSSPAGPAG